MDSYLVEMLCQSRAFNLSLVTFSLIERCDDGGDDGCNDLVVHEQCIEMDDDADHDDSDDEKDSHFGSYSATRYHCVNNMDQSLQGSSHFGCITPDDEEGNGPTGNEGSPLLLKLRWYRATAIVLSPRSSLVPVEAQGYTETRDDRMRQSSCERCAY